MFSGIGGFEYGIKQAFSNKQFTEVKQDRQGGNRNSHKRRHDVLSTSRSTPFCIGYSEIDKYAIQIYEKHFKHKNYGDATTIDTKQLPDFDLLVGGFPCQAFSIAGKRKGFDDTRGTLFFEIARILADKRPRYFVLENVKGLLSHDEGKTFQTILGVLTDLGYEYQWQVLNSKNFGVPQNRERVFIVGHLRGEPRPKVFPIGESDGISSEKNSRQQGERERICSTIDSRYGALRNSGETYIKRCIPVLTPNREQKRQNGRRFKTNGEPAFTLTGQDIHGVYDGLKIRRLTPTECERLQGFPDGWTEGISDTQRYKCLGNAVTTNVVQAVIDKLSQLEEGKG